MRQNSVTRFGGQVVMDFSMYKKKVSIIVPTYQEVGNLSKLIQSIDSIRPLFDALECIIVDDNSQDGTAALIEKLKVTYPWVHLIIRTDERGLSTAVIEGFKAASGDILVCMDADLSHPVDAVPLMVEKLLQEDADMVVGSRNINGGSVYDQWSLFRMLNAAVAKLLARPFTAIKDPMSGFFCLKRSTFIKAAPLNPIGYKIGLELIVKCGCKQIVEIPIHFNKRYQGTSKLNTREMLNYLRHLWRLASFSLRNSG